MMFQFLKENITKKSREELIELGLQLHELLTQAFKEQQNTARIKTRCRLLEQELAYLKLPKQTSNYENKVPEDHYRLAAELVEQNHELKSRLNILEDTLPLTLPKSFARIQAVKITISLTINNKKTSNASFSTSIDAKSENSLSCCTNEIYKTDVNIKSCSTNNECTSKTPPAPTTATEKKRRPQNLPKAPPKLFKPNPPVLSQTATHRRLPFCWPSVPSDSPPRIRVTNSTTNEKSPGRSVRATCKNESDTKDEQCLPTRIKGSIFDFCSSTQTNEKFERMLLDSKLDEWFTKKSVEPSQKKNNASESFISNLSAKRLCVLSPAASQKYLINIRCLTKPYGQVDSWNRFKEAMFQCQLTKYQINLLLETVPDREISQGSRKLQEWEDHVAKVSQLKMKDPEIELYEEEQFVDFISTFPNIHQRLQCMLVMKMFPELLCNLNGDMDALFDAIEAIIKSEGLACFFHAILLIGNRQNEDTRLGNRKWFRISTLKRVINYRGVGSNGKSLLTFIASHLHSIIDPDELTCLEKAAQISIAQIVQKTTHLDEVFSLLSDETTDGAEKKLLVNSNDINDEFISTGKQFVLENKQKFIDLNQDMQRLLQNYHSCVTYIGDPEAFLPVHKKVQDERNPSQTRFVQDVFSLLVEVLHNYRTHLREVEENKTKTHTTVKSDKNIQPLFSDNSVLKEQISVTQGSSADLLSNNVVPTLEKKVIYVPAKDTTEELTFLNEEKCCEKEKSIDAQLSRPKKTNSAPFLESGTAITLPKVDEAVHHIISVSSPKKQSKLDGSIISAPTLSPTTPNIFSDKSFTQEMKPPISEKLVSDSPSLVETVSTQETMPVVTMSTTLENSTPLDSDNVKRNSILNVTTYSENARSCIPQTISLLNNPILKAQRRRESLRTVANFFTDEREFRNDISSNDTSLLSHSLTRPRFVTGTDSDTSNKTLERFSMRMQQSMLSNPTSLLGKRIASRRLANTKLETVLEEEGNEG
ncbi:uncharacterized protein LOC128884092 isoform X2 [Hylaeus volcanicus]|uniref:uncharacterized protein LOC128884092 isoform X2 n=1 Tax=Hylaeus volcanicus TaxID=313075 RepID=UPI0023B7A59B|nr:uncharacterized protein LOC128884092 isoform X2 [Hylaeus volcanicus]